MLAVAAFTFRLLVLSTGAAQIVLISPASPELILAVRLVGMSIRIHALSGPLAFHPALIGIVLLLVLTIRLLPHPPIGLTIGASAELLVGLSVVLSVGLGLGLPFAAGGVLTFLILPRRSELVPVFCPLSPAPKLIVALLIRHLSLAFLEVRQGNG